MPTYMVWETEGPRGVDAASPYSGGSPEVAILAFCEEHEVEQMELVTAAEAEELEPDDRDMPVVFRCKPGGKSWTTQVEYESSRDYSVCGLSEDDQ